MPVRLALVDDHEMFREGLRATLAREHRFRLVLEAADARSALRQIEKAEFDVMLVDIALPGSDGIALVRELRRRRHAQPTIMLTMHFDADVVAESLLAGARGHVCKTQSTGQLYDAIDAVLAGTRYVPPGVDRAQLELAMQRRGDSPLSALTPREREVFYLLSQGGSNAEIAAELSVSLKTVRTHRAHIFEKLQVHNVSELLRLAARHNLLVPVARSRGRVC